MGTATIARSLRTPSERSAKRAADARCFGVIELLTQMITLLTATQPTARTPSGRFSLRRRISLCMTDSFFREQRRKSLPLHGGVVPWLDYGNYGLTGNGQSYRLDACRVEGSVNKSGWCPPRVHHDSCTLHLLVCRSKYPASGDTVN